MCWARPALPRDEQTHIHRYIYADTQIITWITKKKNNSETDSDKQKHTHKQSVQGRGEKTCTGTSIHPPGTPRHRPETAMVHTTNTETHTKRTQTHVRTPRSRKKKHVINRLCFACKGTHIYFREPSYTFLPSSVLKKIPSQSVFHTPLPHDFPSLPCYSSSLSSSPLPPPLRLLHYPSYFFKIHPLHVTPSSTHTPTMSFLPSLALPFLLFLVRLRKRRQPFHTLMLSSSRFQVTLR